VARNRRSWTSAFDIERLVDQAAFAARSSAGAPASCAAINIAERCHIIGQVVDRHGAILHRAASISAARPLSQSAGSAAPGRQVRSGARSRSSSSIDSCARQPHTRPPARAK